MSTHNEQATARPVPSPRGVGQSVADPATEPPDTPFGALRSVLTGRARHLYGAAVLRVGYGLLYLVFLLREFPHRDEIWGPGSPWTPALTRQLFDQTGWVSVLTLSDSRLYFEAVYALAMLTAALFLLGWHTRVVSVVFAVLVASFHAKAIFVTDGGDNLILLMALYLSCTACGRRWSLDARRAKRRAAAKGHAAPVPPGAEAGRPGLRQQLTLCREELTTALHNCAMVVIAVQVCVLYGAAGLFKVQGGAWGNGTALHYVLNLDLFRPWPALSSLVDSHEVLLTVICYLTVLSQVAFPFVLFGRLKYPVLGLMLATHLSIAALMGLPLFSGAMIVADAVFLSDGAYRWLAGAARGRLRGRRRPPEGVDDARPGHDAPEAAHPAGTDHGEPVGAR
ncbi:HTTM domain-containing protein [Streptomyces triticirhizae]|uniref:HTTM domain-containing protein n=1 Tax=Streptomyces triticirhizae TaxID=2483353 RepID=A0A3M2M6N2_9ACTN|nr:HTTM domain-containing protein [Streptomyces triticirhizae]RMI45211.1 HTTM domain-containing protein [Streptomyces triticirhizae]